MDLRHSPPARRSKELPRPCGDRPGVDPSILPYSRAPPPARRSTPLSRHACGLRPSSPAHAGIDPILLLVDNAGDGFPTHAGMIRPGPDGRRRRCGVPRPRGDRPLGGPLVLEAGGVPPPTRGSTPLSRLARQGGAGFPAPAGIDPGQASSPTGPTRLPRLRGDSPKSSRPSAGNSSCSPPTRGRSAGMDLERRLGAEAM